MKKIWKLTLLWGLALCLFAGCGTATVQPERQPLENPAAPVAPVIPGVPAEPTTPVTPSQTVTPSEPGVPVPPTEPNAPAAPVAPTEPPAEGNTTSPAVPPVELNPTGPDAPPAQPDQPETPAPVPPEEQVTGETQLTCTLEIRCDTILNNWAQLDPDKAELVPADGVLFAAAEVVFYEGESVFNVLQRTLKQNKLHMESVQSPLYNSAYIEGICNLYNYDCGPLSGWLYRVNDWYPNYGCSQYVLQAGDSIVWDFTCDLGADLGVEDYTGNNQ